MYDKPDDIPQWAWDKAFDLVRTWYAEEWESPPSYIKVILIKDVAYAILQARSQARLSEAVKVLKSVCAIDAGRAEWHAARQFLATLGEENHDG